MWQARSRDLRPSPASRSTPFADQQTDRLPRISRPTRQTRQPRQRRGRGKAVVIWLIVLVAIAAALIIGARLASDNIVKPIVANQLEDDVNEGVQTIVGSELASYPVPPGQSQQFAVSEAEINQRIDEQQDLGPLDDARAELTPEGIEVHMDAYGLSGVYRAQVAVRDGVATIESGSMSGPLSYIMPVDELERTINQAIAGSLNEAGMRVTQATLGDGEIVLTLESTGA